MKEHVTTSFYFFQRRLMTQQQNIMDQGLVDNYNNRTNLEKKNDQEESVKILGDFKLKKSKAWLNS